MRGLIAARLLVSLKSENITPDVHIFTYITFNSNPLRTPHNKGYVVSRNMLVAEHVFSVDTAWHLMSPTQLKRGHDVMADDLENHSESLLQRRDLSVFGMLRPCSHMIYLSNYDVK